ncbi:MAG: TIGR03960 family B12-binding radical SAM protein [Anaerolineae bacterium]|nr:TIGR03960 family B12-binding radical SAM protein [Anaerolineae bacterium]
MGIVDQRVLDCWLPTVSKPMQYVGAEWNAVKKPWDEVFVRFALAYPDVYEVGMSNIGVQILYDVVNGLPDALCERVFAPWPDMEAVMRAQNIPLYALESRHALADFDLIGFSLPYELNLTNVLNMIDLTGLPMHADERGETSPLIVAGGSGAYHPEPLADFIDAFVIGEGEEVLVEIMAVLGQAKRAEADRLSLLKALARVPGVYVPCFYDVEYLPDGRLASMTPNALEAQLPVVKRVVDPLPPAPLKPILPYVQPVHDRAVIEIMRGCTQGCRFCQAGMIYRHRRERPCEEVVQAVEAIVRSTGHNEVGLISLSSADHSQIKEIVQDLLYEGRQPPLGVTLPSLRTDAFSVELAQLFQGTRRSGLTFAPEAGSQRLRDAINKKVAETDLLHAVEAAYANQWQRVKLYFMIGLPTETDEDVEAIVDLVQQVAAIGYRYHRNKANVSVTVSTLVPKPHTPFQWQPLIDDETLQRRQRILQGGLRDRSIRLGYHDSKTTLLEAVISRGDRRLGRVIEHAWRAGARFDAWEDQLNWTAWMQAFSAEGIDPEIEARRERTADEVLPWDHISCGVTKHYLWREYERSVQGKTTRDCREGCTNCGAIELLGCVAEQPSGEGDR